jgi:hypothetical protein
MSKRLDAGAIYDQFERSCPGQSMTREAFVKECDDLMCPHKKVQDLTRMTMERGRQRALALYSKNEIDKAVGGKLNDKKTGI